MSERNSNLKSRFFLAAATGLTLLSGPVARADQSKDKFHCPPNGDVVALNNPNNHHLQEEVVFGEDGTWLVNASRGQVEAFHYPAQAIKDENLLIGDGRREASGFGGRFEVIPNRNWMRASWACYSGFEEATYGAVHEAGRAVSPSGKNIPGWFQLECDAMVQLAKAKLGNEIVEIKDMNTLVSRILNLLRSDSLVLTRDSENWFARIKRTLSDAQLKSIAQEFAQVCIIEVIPTSTSAPSETPKGTASPTPTQTREASETPTASPTVDPYPPKASATATGSATPAPTGTFTVTPDASKTATPAKPNSNNAYFPWTGATRY